MKLFKWTNDIPTTPGWYWHKQFNGKIYLKPEIFNIIAIDNRLIIDTGERQWDLALISKECMWAGPIKEPI